MCTRWEIISVGILDIVKLMKLADELHDHQILLTSKQVVEFSSCGVSGIEEIKNLLDSWPLRQESSPCDCEDISVAQARWKKEVEELHTQCIHIKEELTKIQLLFNLEVEPQNDHVSFTSFADEMLLLVPPVHPRFCSTIGPRIYPLHSAFLMPIMS